MGIESFVFKLMTAFHFHEVEILVVVFRVTTFKCKQQCDLFQWSACLPVDVLFCFCVLGLSMTVVVTALSASSCVKVNH